MKNVLYTISTSLVLLTVLSLAACTKTVPQESPASPVQAKAESAEQTESDAAFAGGAATGEERAPAGFDEDPPEGTRAYCLVMETNFTVTEGSPRSVYKGKHYVFCCPPCKAKFDEDPEKYI
jgi:YHS domain-containing protein/predicted small lipoprotein YifL